MPTTKAWIEQLESIRSSGEDDPHKVVSIGIKLIEKGYATSNKEEVWSFLEQVATAAIQCGQLQLAQVCITRLESRFPESPRVAVLHGMLLEAQGRTGEAIKHYQKWLRLDDTDINMRKRLITLHLYSSSSSSSLSTTVSKTTTTTDVSIIPNRERGIKMLVEYLDTFYNDPEGWSQLANIEWPVNADRSIESYYIQASRISYLPLFLSSIKSHYLDLILDQSTSSTISIDDLWLDYNGVPLKWHWPIGLLYDYHSATFTSSSSSSSTTLTPRSSPRASPTRQQFHTRVISSISTIESTNSPANPFDPIPIPWKITLHSKDPPKDALLLSNGVENCRSCFMNMIKEAEYVRWGNVKRVTNLRKEQQDGLWEGVINNDYDKFWSIASRLIPLPNSTLPPPSPALGSTSTFDSTRIGDTSSASMKSIPLKVYLPDGGPVLQDLCPTTTSNGSPATLLTHLSTLIPLLFPPPPRELSFESPKKPLGQCIIQGIIIPLETELQWLASTMSGCDGWVGVVVRLLD